MKQWSALYVFLHSYGVRNSIENLRAFYITPSMHNLISIFRCNFVSVCNIEQKHMHGFSWHFQDRSNIAQGTTWSILRTFQTTMQMQKVFWGIRVYCMRMCVWGVGVGVGRLVEVGGGVLIDCFVSGYTNFIDVLFCFCSNLRACYNHSHLQQYLTCIMLTKISDD